MGSQDRMGVRFLRRCARWHISAAFNQTLRDECKHGPQRAVYLHSRRFVTELTDGL
jgi:hypothetical protein